MRASIREKLEAMASQDVSPHEAAIARAKLAEMGGGHREPPRTRVASPAGDGWQFGSWSFAGNTTSTSGSYVHITWGPTA